MGDVGFWTPTIERALLRHGLDAGRVRPTVPGTHATFAVGGEFFIKLFVPTEWFEGFDDYAAEVESAEILAGNPNVPTTKLLAHSVDRGWPYVITTRLPGKPLTDVRPELTRRELVRLVAQLGDILHALHDASVDRMPETWHTFVARRRIAWDNGGHMRRAVGCQIEDRVIEFLDSAGTIPDPAGTASLLHGDLGAEHVFVERQTSGWRISGILDFGDAMHGERVYDIVGPGLDIARGDPELLRLLIGPELTRAYGIDDLRRRLMVYTLIHLWTEAREILEWIASGGTRTLDEVAEQLWPLG